MTVKVIIPIYRSELTREEQMSLRQTEMVLGRYPIVLLVPEELDVTPVTEIFPGHTVLRVSGEWLGTKGGIAGYNRMMMSKAFYELFADTDYLLICQTDAWIFRDELEQWCRRGYDYVGAPHPKRAVYRFLPVRLYLALRRRIVRGILRQDIAGRVYNGGLSLRRTKSFIGACEKYRERAALFLERPHHFYNEDVFWSLIPREFSYPAVEEALEFAFDVKPEYCYRLTQGRLPFGCHGWYKPPVCDFWRTIIR